MYSPDRDLVLLFYKDFERDSFVKNDRYLKRLVRPIYHGFSKGPKVSGFFVWYQLLIKALRGQGLDVRLNDYRLAKKYPGHPVGLVGYPRLIDDWKLPNPAILGPSLFDHPGQAPNLMTVPSNRYYLVTCQWMLDMFRPWYGDKAVLWHAGIDAAEWDDTQKHRKFTDVLIYDKIRWNRDRYEPELLQPILNAIARRGLSTDIIRYKFYDHETYKRKLSGARSMIFLCEHETQGMAYQEAMAANIPILAWDQGYWLDPAAKNFSSEPIGACSVPYFSRDCGERFDGIGDFEMMFEKFWSRLDTYTPRTYVKSTLSFKSSAELYMQYYNEIAMDLHNNAPEHTCHKPLDEKCP